MSVGNEGDSETIERVQTPRGELVLRRRGSVFEIISNGVFLMDTSDGRSERLLAGAAIDDYPVSSSVLIAGLGVGFTLAEILRRDEIEKVTVVEIEDAIVRWNTGPLAAVNGNALQDPRVRVVVADFRSWIAGPTDAAEAFDAICLDVDNGPEWTVTDENRRIYAEDALRLLKSRLVVGGRLAVWSAAPAPAFVRLLRRVFGDVRTSESPTAAGLPDLVWIASRAA